MPLYSNKYSDTNPSSVGATNSPGILDETARIDHQHSGLTRGANDFNQFTLKSTPVSNDIILLEDSQASGAKKYTTIGDLSSTLSSGGTANEATGTTTITTSSTSYNQMTSMTLTPIAGNYLVWLTGNLSNNTNNANSYVAIHINGTIVTSSERIHTSRNSPESSTFTCVALVTVNGSQAIQGYWRVSSGTATNTRRSLAILKVG